MINHLNLAKNLKSNSLNSALDIYASNVKDFKDSSIELKTYLSRLNIFLYTYFLVQYNKDLESYALNINKVIIDEQNLSDLYVIGKKMLMGYANKFTIALRENDHILIERALEYINKNYWEKITLASVASKLHISRNYLCHLFKIKTGYTFCEYVNLQRINKAKALIEEDKKTFEFISYACGFSSQSHFSTTFKKYEGLSPNEYKKQAL